MQAFISYPWETKVWEVKKVKVWPSMWPWKVGQGRPSQLPALWNVPSYDNVKFKWNPNKRHEQNGQKPQKRSKFDLCDLEK